MAKKLTAPMPEGMDLDGSYTIQWAALDPTDGSDVAGVVVSAAAMLVTQVTPGTAGDLAADNFVPLLTPIELEAQSDDVGSGS